MIKYFFACTFTCLHCMLLLNLVVFIFSFFLSLSTLHYLRFRLRTRRFILYQQVFSTITFGWFLFLRLLFLLMVNLLWIRICLSFLFFSVRLLETYCRVCVSRTKICHLVRISWSWIFFFRIWCMFFIFLVWDNILVD